MAAGKVKAEKPALTLNFDKEAAEDLEYIARLIGTESVDALSLALGILKKIAEEKRRGNRTYIDIGAGRKEEILIPPRDSRDRTREETEFLHPAKDAEYRKLLNQYRDLFEKMKNEYEALRKTKSQAKDKG